jgi:hypothetical protein
VSTNSHSKDGARRESWILRTPLALPLCLLNTVLVVVAAVPMFILSQTVLRGRCQHCGRRGLRGVRLAGDTTLHPGDNRPFHFSECDYCKHQFHRFDDRSRIHIPPEDPRYITV